MKTVSKALVGTIAAGAMAASAATPAFAQDRHRDRGPDAGEIIAGAVILGGIAAILSSSKRDRGNYRNARTYRGDRYQKRGNPRQAVERCVRAAERQARQSGFRYADVTQIRDVDDTRYGYRVKGRIVVEGQRGFRGYRGERNRDRRGYRNRGDNGKFTCFVGRGQRAQVDFSGIRGLR